MKDTRVRYFVLLLALSSAVFGVDAQRRRVPPKLTFFCEVDPINIPKVSDQSTIRALSTLNATVSIAIRDFSVERAEFIRRLNQNNITTSAWLVVNYTEGYWANINNADTFVAMYSSFREWSQRHGLKWDAVALDLELDFREVAGLATGDLTPLITAAQYRLQHPQVLTVAKATYSHLVDTIRADGYRAESYIFPFIYDECRANSQLLELLLGLVDVSTIADEVPMLYTSGLPLGLGFLKSYGEGLKAVAIGTAGGDPLNASIPETYSNWEELERDFLYSYHYLTPNIYVYSLAGIVNRGWLSNIVNLNWNKSLSFRDRAAYEIEGALVDALRDTLVGLLNTAQVPSGAVDWLTNNDFETFAGVLDFLFNYLGWK